MVDDTKAEKRMGREKPIEDVSMAKARPKPRRADRRVSVNMIVRRNEECRIEINGNGGTQRILLQKRWGIQSLSAASFSLSLPQVVGTCKWRGQNGTCRDCYCSKGKVPSKPYYGFPYVFCAVLGWD